MHCISIKLFKSLGIAICIEAIGAALLQGCSESTHVESQNSANAFLSNIMQIAHHGTLADYKFTSNALHLDLSIKEREVVHNDADSDAIGLRVEIYPKKFPIFISRTNFGYGIFESPDGNPIRATLSFSLHDSYLCVRRSEVLTKFGKPERNAISTPRSNQEDFFYTLNTKINLNFDFIVDRECLHSISWSQNFEK